MSPPNMNDLFKQVQKMQEKISEAQEGLAELRAEGSAGGGIVTAVANGKQEILGIRIDKNAIDPTDVELLEDLIVAAVNQALSNSQEAAKTRISSATGGLLGSLPGSFKLPGL